MPQNTITLSTSEVQLVTVNWLKNEPPPIKNRFWFVNELTDWVPVTPQKFATLQKGAIWNPSLVTLQVRGATVNGGNGKWKRKVETENGNGKRKAEKGKGRHCNTYNVIVQASYRHARPG